MKNMKKSPGKENTWLKRTWLKICAMGSLFMSEAVLASGDAGDVFEPLNDKTDQIRAEVVGWANGLSVLCIVIFGVLTMINKLPKVWGVSICAGCFIILVGVNIADFLMAS